MKRYLFLFLGIIVIALFSGCSRARVFPMAPSQEPSLEFRESATSVSITPALPQVPLHEELEYHVFWWGMRVGTVLLKTEPIPAQDLRTIPGLKPEWIKLSAQARSNWALETFYPVRVNLTSFVDASGNPHRFEGTIKRQWREHESVIIFNWAENLAIHQLPTRVEKVAIEPKTQDGLSMLYHARMIPFALGQDVPLTITADGKNWLLKGRIVKAQMVKIGDLGEYPAVEGKVELAYPVPFFQGARARVWFSTDGQRIPLLAKIRSRIGRVTVVLTRREKITD